MTGLPAPSKTTCSKPTGVDVVAYWYWRCRSAVQGVADGGRQTAQPDGSTASSFEAAALFHAPFASRNCGRKVFASYSPGTKPNLIEAKRSLNRGVIGQAVAARQMFRRQYGVSPERVTVLCGRTDAALEWVCLKEAIHVEVETPG